MVDNRVFPQNATLAAGHRLKEDTHDTCSSCMKLFGARKKRVQCDMCQLAFHLACDDSYCLTSMYEDRPWICTPCARFCLLQHAPRGQAGAVAN